MRRSLITLIGGCSVLALLSWTDAAQAARSPRNKTPASTPAASPATSSAADSPGTPKKSNEGQLLDHIVAVVDDGVVLQSELDQRVRDITTQLGTQNIALPPEATLRSQ